MRKKYLIIALLIIIPVIFIFTGDDLNDWDIKNLPENPQSFLCFGDSLVAGVGADTKQTSYPGFLKSLINKELKVVGVNGRTTADGLGALDGDKKLTADVVIVTLGGNDVLQRVPLDDTISNLEKIFIEFQKRGACVVFTGVDGPFGGRNEKYLELCRKNGVLYVPRILKGILSDPALKADPIHPNSDGYKIMAERVTEVVKKNLLEKAN